MYTMTTMDLIKRERDRERKRERLREKVREREERVQFILSLSFRYTHAKQ
jgi:hypothetical protein